MNNNDSYEADNSSNFPNNLSNLVNRRPDSALLRRWTVVRVRSIPHQARVQEQAIERVNAEQAETEFLDSLRRLWILWPVSKPIISRALITTNCLRTAWDLIFFSCEKDNTFLIDCVDIFFSYWVNNCICECFINLEIIYDCFMTLEKNSLGLDWLSSDMRIHFEYLIVRN